MKEKFNYGTIYEKNKRDKKSNNVKMDKTTIWKHNIKRENLERITARKWDL